MDPSPARHGRVPPLRQGEWWGCLAVLAEQLTMWRPAQGHMGRWHTQGTIKG